MRQLTQCWQKFPLLSIKKINNGTKDLQIMRSSGKDSLGTIQNPTSMPHNF